jgi:DNA-binding transcriptional ArsR family regulator
VTTKAKGKQARRGVADNTRLHKALSHPLRQTLLEALQRRVASPSELAEELNEPIGNVSYHVKVLAENDAIELVKTEAARGAIEHFYRATARSYFDDEQWAQLPLSARRGLTGQTLKDIWRDLAAAAQAGKLDEPTTHITRSPLELDDEAYQELNELLLGLVDRALELYAESQERLAEVPDQERQTHRTELVNLHFHRDQPD